MKHILKILILFCIAGGAGCRTTIKTTPWNKIEIIDHRIELISSNQVEVFEFKADGTATATMGTEEALAGTIFSWHINKDRDLIIKDDKSLVRLQKIISGDNKIEVLRNSKPATYKIAVSKKSVHVSGHSDYPSGSIWKKGIQHPFSTTQRIRYLPASHVYKILKGEIWLPLRSVDRIEIIKPKSLDNAIMLVRGKKYSEAIPVLEKILDDYRMFQWDQEAARWLAEIYIKTDEPAKAVELFEMDWYFLPPNKDFEKLYVHALEKTGQKEKLDAFLKKIQKREKSK